ncbi:transmembrane protein 45B-like [Babylonia areolata]|uniref:transmembrane protein 45B-like n=1 Tax=Babylonia areolata TaxID=304850 RepID=UPI003FD21E8E
MTSFWGYVTEGVLLLVLAQWWLINTCVDIITCKHRKQVFRPRVTYPWPGTTLPVEILYKLSISVFGVLAQLLYGGGRFHDENGDFRSMDQLMYMSIYGIFCLHALLDLLLWLRLPLVRGSHYASAATGFFWYAVALHYSAQDYPDEGVKVMVLTFPVFVLLPVSACFVLDPLWRRGFTVHVARAYFLQVYATWCFQSAHALHSADAFPGSAPNPNWDPTDHRNVAYTAAFFGLHLCINLLLVAAAYTATAVFLRVRQGVKVDNGEDYVSGSGYTSVPSCSHDGDGDGRDFDMAASSKFLAA